MSFFTCTYVLRHHFTSCRILINRTYFLPVLTIKNNRSKINYAKIEENKSDWNQQYVGYVKHRYELISTWQIYNNCTMSYVTVRKHILTQFILPYHFTLLQYVPYGTLERESTVRYRTVPYRTVQVSSKIPQPVSSMSLQYGSIIFIYPHPPRIRTGPFQ